MLRNALFASVIALGAAGAAQAQAPDTTGLAVPATGNVGGGGGATIVGGGDNTTILDPPVDKMPLPHGRHSMERRIGALRPNILWC